jgi:2-polyprenyl-6-methoxyphenol hydroxylase-like FAD-dependent oxidoreductase
MTTPLERVRALVEAIADLRRGDIEAALDLEHYAQALRKRAWRTRLVVHEVPAAPNNDRFQGVISTDRRNTF